MADKICDNNERINGGEERVATGYVSHQNTGIGQLFCLLYTIEYNVAAATLDSANE